MNKITAIAALIFTNIVGCLAQGPLDSFQDSASDAHFRFFDHQNIFKNRFGSKKNLVFLLDMDNQEAIKAKMGLDAVVSLRIHEIKLTAQGTVNGKDNSEIEAISYQINIGIPFLDSFFLAKGYAGKPDFRKMSRAPETGSKLITFTVLPNRDGKIKWQLFWKEDLKKQYPNDSIFDFTDLGVFAEECYHYQYYTDFFSAENISNFRLSPKKIKLIIKFRGAFYTYDNDITFEVFGHACEKTYYPTQNSFSVINYCGREFSREEIEAEQEKINKCVAENKSKYAENNQVLLNICLLKEKTVGLYGYYFRKPAMPISVFYKNGTRNGNYLETMSDIVVSSELGLITGFKYDFLSQEFQPKGYFSAKKIDAIPCKSFD